jgi:hypothetical protein
MGHAGNSRVRLYSGRQHEAIRLSEVPGDARKDCAYHLTHGQIIFIGIAEIVGVVGLVAPLALHIAPRLMVYAAAGLALIMLSATIYHIRRREPPIMTAVLFVLAIIVAVGRARCA